MKSNATVLRTDGNERNRDTVAVEQMMPVCEMSTANRPQMIMLGLNIEPFRTVVSNDTTYQSNLIIERGCGRLENTSS